MEYKFNQFEFNIDPIAHQSVRQGTSWGGKKVFFKPKDNRLPERATAPVHEPNRKRLQDFYRSS